MRKDASLNNSQASVVLDHNMVSKVDEIRLLGKKSGLYSYVPSKKEIVYDSIERYLFQLKNNETIS